MFCAPKNGGHSAVRAALARPNQVRQSKVVNIRLNSASRGARCLESDDLRLDEDPLAESVNIWSLQRLSVGVVGLGKCVRFVETRAGLVSGGPQSKKRTSPTRR